MRILGARKSSKRRLVEARRDQLPFSRMGVDVAYREYLRRAGLKPLGIDDDLFAFDLEPPFGDRPQFGGKVVKD
jgi:hypothetical protein